MDTLLQMALWRQLIILIPLGVVLCIAAYTDWRERKVYNWLSYSAIGLGIIAHSVTFGWNGLMMAFITTVAVFVAGLFMFMVLPAGWFSAGDIKLCVAVAAFLGYIGLAEMLFYSVLVGGVLGVVMSLINGYMWEMIRRLGRFLRGLARAILYQTTMVTEKLERDERSRVPFAVAMLAGMILAYTDRRYGVPNLIDLYIDALTLT